MHCMESNMIDFRETCLMLEKATGLKGAQIARKINIPPSTYNSLKNGLSRDPGFHKGLALIELYVDHCGREIPRS